MLSALYIKLNYVYEIANIWSFFDLSNGNF